MFSMFSMGSPSLHVLSNSLAVSSGLNPSCEHSEVTEYQSKEIGLIPNNRRRRIVHSVHPLYCTRIVRYLPFFEHMAQNVLSSLHGVDLPISDANPTFELHLRPNSAVRHATAFCSSHFCCWRHGMVEWSGSGSGVVGSAAGTVVAD
ncbi:hypothetical protein A0H81_06049 [Grifola frondosa]|uniref:Uncharacterized protein n=1 Tax=Grifola frondosa TaxID=5627 RepID=A0A1C7MAB6_GRIFR|nr:hypothetical protein A0H81_06049 [Grifola frondosa]